MTKASNGLDRHYCVPLLSLKLMRNQTCLKLCRARQDGRYDLWAKLNFATYESAYHTLDATQNLHEQLLTSRQEWSSSTAPSQP